LGIKSKAEDSRARQPAPLRADFHLHSCCSDGRLEPASVVRTAAQAGVGALALTDHDTTEGVAAAAAAARELGVVFAPGIEMTTYGCGRVVHVLGLGVDPACSALQEANDTAARVWDANQCRWVEALAAEGFEVGVAADFPDHPVRLPVLIERLCRRGVEAGVPERVYGRFRRFFAELPASAYAGLPAPEEAAAIIHQAGGLAFVAHPLELLSCGPDFDGMLAACDGLEAVYLAYADPERHAVQAAAARAGKLVSGGSDYHGYFEPAYRHPCFEPSEELMRHLTA
jgi:predicted metal-dependent phosphoesterase TrpH